MPRSEAPAKAPPKKRKTAPHPKYAVEFGSKSREPDEEEKKRRHNIKVMVSTNTPLKAIAELADMSVSRLKLQYQAELNRGHDYVYALVSMRLVEAALAGDRQSQLAWLRNCGGWQEVTRKELTGRDGGPISVRNLDTAALAQVIDALSTQGSSRGSEGRAGQKVIDADPADLDALGGAPDEGAE